MSDFTSNKYLHLGTEQKPGGFVKPYMITAIYPDNDGVVFKSSSGEELGRINCRAEYRARVIQLFVECCDAGREFTQPDLRFLDAKSGK